MLNFKKKFELSPRLKQGVGRSTSQNKILRISSITFLFLALILAVNAFRLALTKPLAPGIQPAAQVLGASSTTQLNDSGQVQFIQYKVQKGDTLFNISQQFNISWTTLATLNNLQAPFILQLGQIINIPK